MTRFLTILCLACGAAVAAAPDDGGVQQWRYVGGPVVEAHFVALAKGRLIVDDKHDRNRSLPVAGLSPECVELAGKMSKLIGVFQPVRDGRFYMGSPDDEPGREDIETRHVVNTGRFFIKATEVTWTEWNAVRNFALGYNYLDISEGENGSQGRDADLNPVVGIKWWDALKWCNLKSQLENREAVYYTDKSCGSKFIFKNGTAEIHVKWQANGYRLPTEAEWEFACRTRNSKWEFHTGAIKETGIEPLDRNLDEAGWYAGNSNGGPHPVAEKRPNDFKLYDMHGNAAEWCWDVAATLKNTEAHDPKGPLNGDKRIVRGGSWNDSARACRAAARGSFTPGVSQNRSIGFRTVRR